MFLYDLILLLLVLNLEQMLPREKIFDQTIEYISLKGFKRT
jgi:hypothetical protein